MRWAMGQSVNSTTNKQPGAGRHLRLLLLFCAYVLFISIVSIDVDYWINHDCVLDCGDGIHRQFYPGFYSMTGNHAIARIDVFYRSIRVVSLNDIDSRYSYNYNIDRAVSASHRVVFAVSSVLLILLLIIIAKLRK